MQSKIKIDFEIQTIKATFRYMRNLKKFISRIEKECADECAVKIIPPSKYKPISKYFNQDEQLKSVVTQKVEKIVSNNSRAFEILYDQTQEMTYEEFIQASAKNERIEPLPF